MTLDQQNPFGEPIGRDWLTDIEKRTDFWNRTPQLQAIAAQAEREKVSPWGLLMGVQLHRLSHIPANVVLVKRDGSHGSSLFSGTGLNLFGGLVADSGGGKSVIFKAASEMLQPIHTPISDGTGQGLVKSIAETEKVTHSEGQKLDEPYYITRFLRHSLVIHAPEIKTLNAEFIREASKTDSMMRSLWSGETVGMTTGDKDRRVTLPANMYRIVGMWGVQAVNATGILAGADDGTPQRWLWAPAEEYRRGSKTPTRTFIPPGVVTFPMPIWNPGGNPFGSSGGDLPTEYKDGDPLPTPHWVDWSPQMQIDIAALQAERDRLRDREPYADVTPELEAAEAANLMQSHLTLTRIKLAAALGFLWGHASPTDDDWELAGVQLEVSTRELAGVWKKAQAARNKEIVVKGEERGKEQFAAQSAKNVLDDEEVAKVAEFVFNILAERPMMNKDLRNKLSHSRRQKLRPALDLLEAQGRFAIDSNGMYWVMYKGTPLPFHMSAQFI